MFLLCSSEQRNPHFESYYRDIDAQSRLVIIFLEEQTERYPVRSYL